LLPLRCALRGFAQPVRRGNATSPLTACRALSCFFPLASSRPQDLNRQLLKSDRAAAQVPELEFEIPPNTQKGVFTTVEGLLDKAIEGLATTQARRALIDPAGAEAVEAFLVRLRACKEGVALPFTLVLDDPSGNSFMENPHAPRHDAAMRVRHYVRSQEQNDALGLFADNARGGVQIEGPETAEEAAAAAAAGAGSESSGAAGAGAGAAPAAPAAVVDEDDDGSTLVGSAAATQFPSTALDAAATASLSSSSSSAAAPSATAAAAAVPRSIHDEPGFGRGLGGGDGNVPGRWRKGGALIANDTTEQAAVTAAARSGGGAAAGAAAAGGRRRGKAAPPKPGALATLFFDSSASGGEKELMRFPVDCTNCGAAGECCMCVTDVPHFKEVILMAFRCDECGWKDVEVKGGGAVPPHGTLTTLRFDPAHPAAATDLSRDVIKGDAASIDIPELELHVEGGSLGGLYTTVEGLLTLIRDKLLESDPYAAEATDSGGAALSDRRAAMGVFLDKLEGCIRGAAAFTLQIRDPMANSWVYSATAPAPDPTLSHEHYARSEVEDRDLGLLDMQTEGYGEEEAEGEEGEEEEAEGAGAADSAASGAAAQPEAAAAAGGAGGAAAATEGAAASVASGALESSAAVGSGAGR